MMGRGVSPPATRTDGSHASPDHTYPGGADGIAYNAAGGLSVIDYLGGLMKTWDTSHAYESEWGVEPRLSWDLARDLSISLSGTYDVADEFNDRIVAYDNLGKKLDAWGSLGTGEGERDAPVGVSVDPAGNVYVTEAGNDRVQVFDPNGVFQFEFGSTGSGDGEFLTPWRVVVDEDGYIYVTDRGNHRVQWFTPEGEYLAQFGSFGSGDGQLDTPTGIALGPNGDVVVSDSNNSRVVTFRATRTF